MVMAYMLKDSVSKTGDENVYVALYIVLCQLSQNDKKNFQYLKKNMAPELINNCVRVKKCYDF